MSDLNQVCADVTNNVPEGLGCAVVDLESGLLMGVFHNVDYFTDSLLDVSAAAAVDMFRGRTVTNIEELVSQYTSRKQSQSIMEMQLTIQNAYVFMAVVKENPNYLIIVVTSKKTNLGSGWAAIRNAMPKVLPFCP